MEKARYSFLIQQVIFANQILIYAQRSNTSTYASFEKQNDEMVK